MTQREKDSSLQRLHFGLEVDRFTGLHGPVSDLETSIHSCKGQRVVELVQEGTEQQHVPPQPPPEHLSGTQRETYIPEFQGPASHAPLGLQQPTL